MVEFDNPYKKNIQVCYLDKHKILLCCGHLYHKMCLTIYEYHKWNDNNCKYPLSICAFCKAIYHCHFEKYDFNPNFWDNFPLSACLLYEFPGYKFIRSLYWEHWDTKYAEYEDQPWNSYPNSWHSEDYTP